MATNSLGRLTLDLAVNLADFMRGMTQAERETDKNTRAMQRQARKLARELERIQKEQLEKLRQQEKARSEIIYQNADKSVKIEIDTAKRIQQVREAGFSATDTQKHIQTIKERARIELAQIEIIKAKKYQSANEFNQTEIERIKNRYALERQQIELIQDEKLRALELEKSKYNQQQELAQARIIQRQRYQSASEFNQSERERIKNRYALEREQIKLIQDEKLRGLELAKAKHNEELELSRVALKEQQQATAIRRKNLAKLALVGGAVATATGALIKMTLETAKADAELEVLANRANTSIKNFQVLGHASQQLGVNQEQLGSILADVQEKLGEFSATEGGGASDFFDALKNNTALSEQEIRKFSKTLQGKDGIEAIQLLKNKLDELGATSQEQRFVFESLASDLGNLLPLFEQGGLSLKEYGEALEEAGVIKTKESIEQSKLLSAQTQAVQTRFNGLKNQLAMQVMPVLNSLVMYFANGSKESRNFGSSLSVVATIAKGVGLGVIGISFAIKGIMRVVEAFAQQAGNISMTIERFNNADGVVAKAKTLYTGLQGAWQIKNDMWNNWGKDFDVAMSAINGSLNNTLNTTDKLVQLNYQMNGAINQQNQGLARSTKLAEQQRKEAEKTAKARAKIAKQAKFAHIQVNSRNWVKYANQKATRNWKLNKVLEKKIAQVLSTYGVTFKVISGGQPAKGKRRTGTHAHDYGHAGDGDLYKNGRRLTFSRDKKLISRIITDLVANGINGVGGAYNYMGDGRLHLGIQKNSVAWGAKGRSINAPKWLKQAHARGMRLLRSASKISRQQLSTAKAVNQRVLNHAQKHNYANTEKRYGLPLGLLSAISMQESRGLASATSYRGAKGEFQFIPATAKQFGIAGQERNTAKASVAAAKLLSYLLKKFGSLDKAIAAYNAGEGNVSRRKWSTIMSKRFANGETMNYVKNVKAYLAYMQKGIDGSVSVNNILKQEAKNRLDGKKAKIEHLKLIEQQKKQHLDERQGIINANLAKKRILLDYADFQVKNQIALQDKIAEIKAQNLSPKSEKRLIAQAKQRANNELEIYKQNHQQKLSALAQFKLNEKQLLEQNVRQSIAKINTDNNLSESEKQQAIRWIKQKANEELKQIEHNEKVRNQSANSFRQTELQRLRNQYELEREEIALNNRLTTEQKQQAQSALYAKNQFDIYNLKRASADSYNALLGDLEGTNELDNLQKQKQAELDVIQNALDTEIITEQQAQRTKLDLERKYYQAKRELAISQYSSIASSLTQITGDMLGRQSKAYRVMFAVEKGFAIARSAIAIAENIAQASKVGFPLNLPLIAGAVAQGASIVSTIQSVRQPTVGQAHDGIENVPREGTWLLDKNERVVKPKDNQKLTKFLDVQARNGNKGMGNFEVTIINNTPANVSAFQDENGRLKVIISNEINKQVPAQLANPNSNISKSLKNNFGLMPAR